MKEVLLLGSVASACPPLKQGGTEYVAYVQAKYLAQKGVQVIFVAPENSRENFKSRMKLENINSDEILKNIEFIEIGGGVQAGNAQDGIKIDPSTTESSRKLRLESVYLTQVMEVMQDLEGRYGAILNNLRSGETLLLPLANALKKPFFTVMHLNLFPELAEVFKKHKARVITIANHQQENFKDLEFAGTINNPVNTNIFTQDEQPEDYALMMGTIGWHKNQEDAILACLKTETPLIISGKIRDQDYFESKIKPLIESSNNLIQYQGEIGFETKLKLLKKAKVFLFPIKWQEPFGLVVIEALSCGVPVIAYPNGGPAEIINNGQNGYLVQNVEEMAEQMGQIDEISRDTCRQDAIERFSEERIGQQYYDLIKDSL